MRRIALALAALLLAAPAALAQAPSPKLIGSWAGTLKMGASEMEIVLNIAPADTGLAVYYDIPAQNVRGMQIPETRVAGNAITFPGGNGRYEGTVNATGTEIAGKYTAGNGSEVPLTFTRLSATPVLPAVAEAVEDPTGLAGDFTGRIEAGAGLEATIHLRRLPDGGYAATLDVPVQNALGVSASAVTLDGDALTVEFPFGVFAGTFDDAKAALDGTWTQAGREIPFDLVRQ